MFLQIIQGKVHDPAGMQRQMQRWQDELRPGATGYMGDTFGMTADGMCIGYAAFDSKASAMANSERAEQTAWWNETQKYYDGDITFHHTEDITTMMRTDYKGAGFVQVMQGTYTDRARLDALDKNMEAAGTGGRTDIIGGLTAIYGNYEFTAFSYFTSEAEARAGETMPMPDSMQALMAEWSEIVKIDKWYDLTDPWINQ